MTLTDTTRLRRTEHWLGTESNDTVIAMHVTTGRFVAFNETAGLIWKMLDTPRTVAEIGARLADEYEVTPEQAIADMSPLLKEFIENGAFTAEAA